MLTKLDAVNLILDSVGESPVSSLNSGLDDAEQAERFLDNVTTEVVESGWHCNTDKSFKLIPSVEGTIILSSDVARIDTVGRSRHINVTVRKLNGNLCLYDIGSQSYTFANPVFCDIVWNLPFEDLTPTLRNYIAARAARKYQASVMGSSTLDKFVTNNEREAYLLLLEAESANEDLNILTGNAYCRYVTFRNSDAFGL